MNVWATIITPMPIDFLSPAALIITILAAALLFALSAYLTHAKPRLILAALIASIPLIPLIKFYDHLAAQLGWWYYPTIPNRHAPLAWYIAAALFYGAALGLVGWRIIRRFGRRGLVAFLILFGLFGLLRDSLYSLTTGLIAFGPGLLLRLADYLAYASCATIAQLLMYCIANVPKPTT